MVCWLRLARNPSGVYGTESYEVRQMRVRPFMLKKE
jgi:hypothetical protein